eukprot:CAMPEP_0184321306 /NCGR_PEP_ID=MMETSP1049-20130417/118228_1 /TAXON_ID=77928 /ORGANISM="Proteomonas sulcata, Strain CCMP704" /LENGTH=93 /DNA_ID=CAMNT_0026642055 /DNA_START=191 /DNA_END=468 /DNA_ORIENTATION=-
MRRVQHVEPVLDDAGEQQQNRTQDKDRAVGDSFQVDQHHHHEDIERDSKDVVHCGPDLLFDASRLEDGNAGEVEAAENLEEAKASQDNHPVHT